MLKRLAFCSLALLVVLAAMLPSGRWYQCRMDRAWHAACCCMAAQANEGEANCSTRAGSCCDVVTLPEHPKQHLAAVVDIPDHHDVIAATLEVLVRAPLVAVLVDPAGRWERPPRPCRESPGNSPDFQRSCTLLI